MHWTISGTKYCIPMCDVKLYQFCCNLQYYKRATDGENVLNFVVIYT